MHDEAFTFFDKLREEDHSLLDLLDSDYTYVNEELARYYGIPGVRAEAAERSTLKPEYHRGGLLGMGAVLALTVAHLAHQPDAPRQVCARRHLRHAAPTAAGECRADPGAEDKKAPTTFREQLAQHAVATPIAPAVIARWTRSASRWTTTTPSAPARTELGGRPLDTAGVLPTGEKFNGVAELKAIIHKRQDEFVRNAIAQMLTYALGRQLDYFDDARAARFRRIWERTATAFRRS